MAYDDIVDQAAKQYNLDPKLLAAQIQAESSGNTDAQSPAGASGPAQLMPTTAAAYGVADPTNPAQAIPAMAQIMRENLDKYGDLKTALMAYHGGPNQKIWGPKTQAYPGRVLANYTPPSAGSESSADPLDSLPSVNHPASPQTEGSDPLDSLPAVANHPAVQAPAPQESLTAAPPQIGGDLHTPLFAGSQLIKGAAIAAGIPGDLERLGMNYVGNPLLRTIGQPTEDMNTPGNTLFPTSSDLLEATGRAGLTDRTDLQPQNEGERLVGAGAAGVGSTLPLLPFGPAKAVVPTLLSGAGSGVAAEAAHEHLPGAELPAGVLGAVATGGAVSALTRTGNLLAGNLNQVGNDFATAGVPLRSPAYALDNAVAQGALKPSPQIAAQTEQDLGNSIEQVAAQHGEARTPQQAGEVLQANAQDWLKNTLPAKVSAAWAPIDSAVAPDSPVPLTNFRTALNQIKGQGGTLAPVINLLKPSLPGKISDALEEATGYGMADTGWKDVAALRSAIGEARGTPEVLATIGGSNLSKLYAAATKDMRASLASKPSLNIGEVPDLADIDITGQSNTLGGAGIAKTEPTSQLVQDFDNANAESTRLYNIASNVAGKITKSTNPAQAGIDPGRAAQAMLGSGKQGDYLLGQIRSEMPQGADALAAYQLRKAGLDAPETVGSVVSSKFPKQWATLTPEAKAALFPDPQVRARIDAAASVAQRVRDVGTSGVGTGYIPAVTASMLGGDIGQAIASHLGASTQNVLGSGAGAALLASTAPAITRVGLNALSRSRGLAALASARGASFAVPPWQAGLVAGQNPLYPYTPPQK